jgi:hypothetical protein
MLELMHQTEALANQGLGAIDDDEPLAGTPIRISGDGKRAIAPYFDSREGGDQILWNRGCENSSE